MEFNTTIAAISTPPGKGGVAVIRISGEDAIAIADKIFVSKAKALPSSFKAREAVYGNLYDNKERVDDCILTVFPAPNSYTGENTVEIYCHGGVLLTERILGLILKSGARYAKAGEFTKRAFINGKLTLTEAEAIGNVLEAKSYEQLRLAGEDSRDRLSLAITDIRKELISTMSSIYARIDYPDEDLGEFTDSETKDRLVNIRGALVNLIDTYRTGRAINEGILTAICGKPNVGKSSIYNMILGKDAAIVTDIEGTTRDVLNATVPLGRVLLRLSDTAGIRDTKDPVEKIGVSRSLSEIENAELIIAVFDQSRAIDEDDLRLIDRLKDINATKIAVLNKSDLNTVFDKSALNGGVFDKAVEISCKDGELAPLKCVIDKLFTDEKIKTGEDAIVFSARQNAALQNCLYQLNLAIDSYEAGLFADAASSFVELAIAALDEGDGKAVSDSIVNDIFSKFCVGK